MEVCHPDVGPDDLTFQDIPPLSPCPLLPHSHQPVGLYFLQACLHLLNKMLPLFAFYLVEDGCREVCLSLDSTTSRGLSALHFLRVHTWIPAKANFIYLDSLYCNTSHLLDNMNSPVRPLIGSCRMLLLPYGSELLRLHGRKSHLCR